MSALGIASHMYLVSLPRREDRREQMERLRMAQNLEWTQVDAMDANDPAIERIFDHVEAQRHQLTEKAVRQGPFAGFRWPKNIDALSVSRDRLEPLESDLWVSASSHRRKRLPSRGAGVISARGRNLTCATEDHTISPFTSGLPDFRVLTPPKIACWNSHVSAIRKFIDNKNMTAVGDVAVIVEDDIDMEKNIRERLNSTWGSLPVGWDIVFLGHCWSNESFYPALPGHINASQLHSTRIHPSLAPKCTHAYALSRTGARRVLLHLRYPPFAYSRALDQAFSWLVESGRLRSYSVVPSVIVQRKTEKSDVMFGMGSDWRERLEHGVFGT
ncbi:hypothetical protein BV22DRAFT_1014704 [Leucogyrophana mollusca]|uniref:Uncharacterized protein n=1 Tax=Leucogyrophana mollusca TaxID=85980 RepID=A0ACB8BE27_9AGAM|nr:hypothetical protein BV22DRAFT_1014704 [Leucogyrophana mollusca]